MRIQVDILIEDPQWDSVPLREIAVRAGEGIVDVLNLPGSHEVSVLACDDPRIAELNADFRDKSTPTNVLSWPSVDLAQEGDGTMPDFGAAEAELGDIAIAYDTCAREAFEQGKALNDHVTHLMVHGLLHLLGFDHIRDKDADLMERLESRILADLGIADPYGD